MSESWTYQELIDSRMTVTAYCGGCNHRKVLNLEALRDRYGRDAPAMAADIAPRLVCDQCKSKKATLIYAPDTTSRTNLASPYAKAKGA